ncbi:MAG: DNA-binding protein YbiB, partial [Polaromonas sp.]|nr:DNA-binding protein YbiB [Polaromonas sp.]
VLAAIDIPALTAIKTIADGETVFAPTELLCPGLKRLLDVRRAVGLRNPAHSLVKIMNPCLGKALVVSSYTHPEYAISMAQTFELIEANALLLRGTEGEVVADARRTPQMEAFMGGKRTLLQASQPGTLASVPDLPAAIDSDSTAMYIRAVMSGSAAVPASITRQVEHILQLTSQL